MITVRFFASLRETLGVDSQNIVKTPELASVADVVEALVRDQGDKGDKGDKGEQWRDALLQGQALVAVNQTMADFDTVVEDGDEVAFFPPVTGG